MKLLSLKVFVLLLLACSQKSIESKDLPSISIKDFLDSKYRMQVANQAWEEVGLKKLANGRFALVFSAMTPSQNQDCILEGKLESNKQDYIFRNIDDTELLMHPTKRGLQIISDTSRLDSLCGKPHHIVGNYQKVS